MKPIKIVFDTNIYLAATKKGSYARIHLQRAQPNGPYELFISPEIIIEMRRKLELKFAFSPEESGSFVDMIMLYARLVHPKRKIEDILKDADDHIILECATEAKAQIIVTADRGLLKLKNFEGIAIVHPTMLQYMR